MPRPAAFHLMVILAMLCNAAPAAADQTQAAQDARPRLALSGDPNLRSESVLVMDQNKGHIVYARNSNAPVPIASITKLLTAMVILDARLPMDERITITGEDRDRIKHTGSRLTSGTVLTRREALQLALMASENRAAFALARTYPGGRGAFARAMNAKARQVGMQHAHFVEPTGLDPRNVASAEDLVWMLRAAYVYPEIRDMTTTPSHMVGTRGKARGMVFRNTNLLVRRKRWEQIGLSKTGYINEAGRCLVMQAELVGRPMLIVLLNSWGKYTPIGDSNRLRRWLEAQSNERLSAAPTCRARDQACQSGAAQTPRATASGLDS